MSSQNTNATRRGRSKLKPAKNQPVLGTFIEECQKAGLSFKDLSKLAESRCFDMGQNDTIGKIELNPSFVLSGDETNYKNDIQLFCQLFDELRVNGDYH